MISGKYPSLVTSKLLDTSLGEKGEEIWSELRDL